METQWFLFSDENTLMETDQNREYYILFLPNSTNRSPEILHTGPLKSILSQKSHTWLLMSFISQIKLNIERDLFHMIGISPFPCVCSWEQLLHMFKIRDVYPSYRLDQIQALVSMNSMLVLLEQAADVVCP